MGVLSDFERRLEGAVEGFFARTFRSGLQPIELARALARYLEDHRHVTEDGVVVPNVFRFTLNAKDVERLSSFGESLRRELAEVVVRSARDEGWRLRGHAVVRIEESDTVAYGTYHLAGLVERETSSATGAVDPVTGNGQVPSAPARFRVRVLRGGEPGSEAPLVSDRVLVGRRSDCGVLLEDATVSRQHAAFVRRGDDWWVIDLESTNGTKVNGSTTAERPLRVGDRIEFGDAVVEFVEAQ